VSRHRRVKPVAGVAATPISPGPDNINNQTIKAGESMNMVCYSPDDKMIATNGDTLKSWKADTGPRTDQNI